MTSLNGIGGLGTGASSANTKPAPSVISDEVTPKSQVPKSGPAISPRIVIDPTAGVITQYLNSNGDVQSQLPSITAVAYLRAGLTPDGLSNKESTEA